MIQLKGIDRNSRKDRKFSNKRNKEYNLIDQSPAAQPRFPPFGCSITQTGGRRPRR